uniref:Uncharacterized protein n=1 Tax=Romanomermis culicivorax TaxID=13658 RepID=A0A915IFV6_ROMCU
MDKVCLFKAMKTYKAHRQHLAMSTSRIATSDLAKTIELLIEQQNAQREEEKAQREEEKA